MTLGYGGTKTEMVLLPSIILLEDDVIPLETLPSLVLLPSIILLEDDQLIRLTKIH